MNVKVKKKMIVWEISPEKRSGAYHASQVPVRAQSLGRTSYWMKAMFWIWL
jgi:hypothetical protein